MLSVRTIKELELPVSALSLCPSKTWKPQQKKRTYTKLMILLLKEPELLPRITARRGFCTSHLCSCRTWPSTSRPRKPSKFASTKCTWQSSTRPFSINSFTATISSTLAIVISFVFCSIRASSTSTSPTYPSTKASQSTSKWVRAAKLAIHLFSRMASRAESTRALMRETVWSMIVVSFWVRSSLEAPTPSPKWLTWCQTNSKLKSQSRE